jgi:hypothetical protein
VEQTAATVCEAVRAYVAERLTACGFTITTTYVGAGLIAWDDCCGMLVVVPERIYRSAVWPIEGPDPQGCYEGLAAIQLTALWLACMPTVDDRGRPPSVAAMSVAYTDFLNAAAVVWNALAELPWEWETTGLNQTFLGTEGGCIGVESRLTVGIDEDQWCVSSCP